MSYFNFFSDLLRPALGPAGSRDLTENDALSSSVDLDDIIDEFDEPSKSRSVSTHPSARQTSQSYFSLNTGAKEDETTSFYSALQDGFSLDDCELRSKYGQEFMWNVNRERDAMLQLSDFEVSWCELTYTIEPKVTLGSLLGKLQAGLLSASSSVHGLLKTSTTHNGANDDGGGGAGSGSLMTDRSNSPTHTTGPITILQPINGSFKSSELTAVIGPSGAGKTSLMNFLSRRSEKGFSGCLLAKGADRKLQINAIPQHDHLPEYLTVRENLNFASRLKSSHQDHEKSVNRVSNLLGLDDCLDVTTKNISGGQQKRLTIAQELLSKPDILILDEPTSGLDSLTCLKTLTVLKDLVKASAQKLIDPVAIVLTIHQPQLEAFDLFDKVYVMANGGVAIYDGPPEQCTQFIETYSGLKLPSTDYDPASFLIDIASGEYGQEPINALKRQVKIMFEQANGGGGGGGGGSNDGDVTATELMAKQIAQAKVKAKAQQQLQRRRQSYIPMVKLNRSGSGAIRKGSLHENGCGSGCGWQSKKPLFYLDPNLVKGSSMNRGNFLYKTRILTHRCWLSLVRDPKQLFAGILFHIFIPCCLSFIMGPEPGRSNACPRFNSTYSLKNLMAADSFTDGSVQEELFLSLENIGMLFIALYSCIAANVAGTSLIFTLDMQSSLKEFHNGWYSMSSYIVARILSNLPMNFGLPTLAITLMAVLSGQVPGNSGMPDIYRLIISVLGVILSTCTGGMTGMIFGAIYMGHVTTALFAAQAASLPFVLLSGFLARIKNMPKFVRALSATSLYKHCLNIIFIARFGYNVCQCDETKINHGQITMLDVREDVRAFAKYLLQSQQTEIPRNDIITNSTTLAETTTNLDDFDVFQLFAKQISLYNTFGIEVESCNQVKPYQLYDYGLEETDLMTSFMALVLLFIGFLILLFVVIKFVVRQKTSL